MKKILLIALSLCATASTLLAEDEVEARLRKMETIVPSKVDEPTIKRIKTMIRGKRETEKMIGRSATYFPIFDQYIKEYDLPADLKYITCLETELNPRTLSYAGATGIWQLMSDVKQEFGLSISRSFDERLDIGRATEAALKDLKRLYVKFKNWELALAGYNCGVGRLGSAMKRARSTEFNKVKRYLPEQTQQYIPKFLAFTYIMRNYHHHDMKPALPPLDKQCIASTKVYSYLPLTTVANVTGLTVEFVKELNPHFGEGYIPATEKGANVYLPRRVITALQDHLVKPDTKEKTEINFTPMVVDRKLPKLDEDPNYYQQPYVVAEGETLESIATLLNVAPYNIMLWNNLRTPSVSKGTALTVYQPRVMPKRP